MILVKGAEMGFYRRRLDSHEPLGLSAGILSPSRTRPASSSRASKFVKVQGCSEVSSISMACGYYSGYSLKASHGWAKEAGDLLAKSGKEERHDFQVLTCLPRASQSTELSTTSSFRPNRLQKKRNRTGISEVFGRETD